MTGKKRPLKFAEYRRKRLWQYCRVGPNDTESESSDDGAKVRRMQTYPDPHAGHRDAEGTGGSLLHQDSETAHDGDASGDDSESEGSFAAGADAGLCINWDDSDGSVDGVMSIATGSGGGAANQAEDESSGSGGGAANDDEDESSDNIIATGPVDYLADRNIVSVGRSYVTEIRDMTEFEREMVRLQTENEMSKSACQRVFSLLQRNSHGLSAHLQDWTGTFRSARRRVLSLVPGVEIRVVGACDDGVPVELGPYKAFPQKEVDDRGIEVRYTLFTSKLVDIIAMHSHIHNTHNNPDHMLQFDMGIDGVPESLSGGVSIDVVTVRFVGCRSVYTLAVLRPRRTGLQICDSITLKMALDEYASLCAGTLKAVNKVSLRFVICDAPKRAKILAQKSHSGYLSCQFCHIKGTYLDGAVCFPPEQEGQLSEPRTKATFEECANDAERYGMPDCKGIKGSSLLRRVAGFDYVSNVVQERMHLLDLGITRQLCRHMFGGKIGAPTKRSTGSVYRPVSPSAFDEGAKFVKVPSEFSRRTRDLNYGNWKAEEYRNLYLAFWPLIAEALEPAPRAVWLHFVYLARGLMTRENGFIASAQVRDWIRKFAAAYGASACGYNVHALSHICHLRNLGRLTDTSAVVLEGHYHEMKRRFTSGTPSTGLQAMQDCCVRNLGGHTCERSIRVRPATTSKRCDDSLVFLRQHGLVRVTSIDGNGEIKGDVVRCEPTNYPLPNLDFTEVHSYRLAPSVRDPKAVKFTKDDVVGKGCVVKGYVSLIPLSVLHER